MTKYFLFRGIDMQFYQMTGEAVAKALSGDVEFGLSHRGQAADQKSSRDILAIIRGVLKVLHKKFNIIDLLSLICFFISALFSWLNQNWSLLVLSIISCIIVIIVNVSFASVLFLYRRRFDQRLSEKNQKVFVLRNGMEQEISSEELMVGDIVLLRKGTVLFGDARIIKCDGLFADENYVFSSSITSMKSEEPINEANLTPSEQYNMLWKGSFITKGSGTAIITALGDDCYTEKTGGRSKKKQHSWFYSKQNNIGQLASYSFVLLVLFSFLLSLIISMRFTESILLIGAMVSIVTMNPVSILTEWSYYRTAEVLYQKGAHIRAIDAFDGMSKEKKFYYSAEELVKNNISFNRVENIDSSERDCLSYFTLCMDNHSFSRTLSKKLLEYGLDREILVRSFPIFRKEKDELKNTFNVFADEGRSTIIACGYWNNMLQYLRDVDDSLLKRIEEIECEGKAVWLMARTAVPAIPNLIEFSSFKSQMKCVCLAIFDLSVSVDIAEKISELQKSKGKIYLVNRYHKRLGEYLCHAYGMEDSLSLPPEEPCYTLPELKKNPYVVYDDASPIACEKAKVILNGNISAQEVIYRVKCMFCGIKRALGFLGCFCALVIPTVLFLFLVNVPLEEILYPLLLLRLVLICPCYYLIETVGNCNHYKRSAVLGVFCGGTGLIAAITGFNTALLAAALSSVLLCITFLVKVRKMRPLRRKDLFIFLLTVLAVMIPWLFVDAHWLIAFLFALFPPISSYIIDIFY